MKKLADLLDSLGRLAAALNTHRFGAFMLVPVLLSLAVVALALSVPWLLLRLWPALLG